MNGRIALNDPRLIPDDGLNYLRRDLVEYYEDRERQLRSGRDGVVFCASVPKVRGRTEVLFPNLNYGMALRGLLNYQLAEKAGMSEVRFSRCARGKLGFTSSEMDAISKELNFDRDWLFARPTPPKRNAEETAPAVRMSDSSFPR